MEQLVSGPHHEMEVNQGLPAVDVWPAVLLGCGLWNMFSIEVSEAERLIKLSWSGQVDLDEMRRCAEEIGVGASKMRPGFRVLVDMTDLESMDYTGAPYIGSIMDVCVAKQVEHVVRVIPNPHKDIGLNIMSYLRYGSKVRVTICDNLADATRLLAE
jgi:anti-anti-sigma regulatory factor